MRIKFVAGNWKMNGNMATNQALLQALVRSRRLVGLSVADFVPDKDADGTYARRLVDLVAGLFAPGPAKI